MKKLLFAVFLAIPSSALADFDYHLFEYRKCANDATVRILARSDANTCIDHYLMIKLHFAEVTLEDYERMSASERAEVSKEGYLKFKEWELNKIRK